MTEQSAILHALRRQAAERDNHRVFGTAELLGILEALAWVRDVHIRSNGMGFATATTTGLRAGGVR